MPEWLNVLIRSAALFALTLLLVRLMGKRQTAQLTFFDLVTAIVLGVLAAAVSLNIISVSKGLVALAVWTVLPILISLLSLKYKIVRDIVQGRETILINHGKVLEDKLMEARLTPEDLLSKLRQKNIFQVADVEFALLEPNGDISVHLKKDKQPLNAKTMGINVAEETVPQTVMLDGIIMDEPLRAMGLNRNWLHTELEKAGVAPENVFIAQVDSVGQLYLDLFDDAVKVPKPTARELAYYTLKKCQADCEIYALSTKDAEAKKMYARSAEELSEITEHLKPLLLK
ncbi:uncharacterized membrane protein YcaP (DUF421 family) [Desulfohalotomaculum tongense]|uniref:DUF421 domain-containing protein n=1 Tax=Desulforadius tongensis TaxID=1216062 RepID=UPI001958BC11|nr:DUF421 domain-containing protein [Desulforadius tongensis]MBM7855301.1 uncharacterized membrane protein YcaP (DUF421 family) [Desulforadius tongensis]